jgi:structure-specific recognition protein 1
MSKKSSSTMKDSPLAHRKRPAMARESAADTEYVYRESFDDIHLDLSRQSGKCRFADSGLGWKPSGDGHTFTLDRDQILQGHWSKAARGYEVKVYTRSSGVIQLDGFAEEDFERLSKVFKSWYGSALEHKEHSLRGWNWGKAEFGKAELAFNVQNRPAFEIPYSEIINTNLAGKNEVAVDFSLPTGSETNGVNGHSKGRGTKSGGARDQLVEMRFYIPGTVSKKVKKDEVDKKEEEDGEVNGEQSQQEDGDEDAEEQNAAQLFYETLVDKAEIGEVAGDTYATFLDILHLTPRGRFDVDMYETSFRLRGKTYDYKIQFNSIKKFMLLPKPDDVHMLIVIGLEPPLRQGQTRYPFVVMQFKKDEEVTLDMNMTEEQLAKYEGKLQGRYEAPIANVVAYVFRGLTGKKVTQPSKDFSSHHNQYGVKCSIKANEGHLFCLDKSFLFVPKPATYITIENIALITLSRVGGAVSASRTFDITITMKNGAGEYQFSNINRSEDKLFVPKTIELTHIDREEQQSLEDFFKVKNIRYKNEMVDDSRALLAAALKDDADLASSEDEVVAHRGSADEDSESADEDFQASDDSDVAEEFDSNAESDSEAGSDEEMADADGDVDDEDDEEEDKRPKKKVKSAK